MVTEFYHLSLKPHTPVRFEDASPAEIQALLRNATGCVVGHSGGTPYVDVIIGMESHRVEFPTERIRQAFILEAGQRNIAIHSTRGLVIAFLLIGILVAIVVAGIVAVRGLR